MTTDLSWAFGMPEDRATATHTGDPLDRISVRDYMREVEIGAFQSERGVTQRIRFNIVLEVSRSAAAHFDDVDQVLSYDTITEAVDHQLAAERLNLLETLAERIADEILINPRAIQVFIRIEKLDRIPGSLGIEIVRSRPSGENVHLVGDTPEGDLDRVSPHVVYMPNDILFGDQLTQWLDAISQLERPSILCLDKSPIEQPKAAHPAAQRRIDLLAMDQNAWVLAGLDPRCVVVNSRTELDWAAQQGQMSVWAPSKMVLDAVNKPDAGPENASQLAQWLCDAFGVEQSYALGSNVAVDGHEAVKTPKDFG